MEIYKIYCSDEMSKSGITELNVLGYCKESIIKWWNESGRNRILPIKSIKAVGGNINEWESYD